MKWLLLVAILLSVGAMTLSILVMARDQEGTAAGTPVATGFSAGAPAARSDEPLPLPGRSPASARLDQPDGHIELREERGLENSVMEAALRSALQELELARSLARHRGVRLSAGTDAPPITQVQALYREDPDAEDQISGSGPEVLHHQAHALPEGTGDVLLVERLSEGIWEPLKGWRTEDGRLLIPVAKVTGASRTPLAGVRTGSLLRVTLNLREHDRPAVVDPAPAAVSR